MRTHEEHPSTTPTATRPRQDRAALAALLSWLVGLPLVVASTGSKALTLVGLLLLTVGTAIIGISARRAEQHWYRERRPAEPRSTEDRTSLPTAA